MEKISTYKIVKRQKAGELELDIMEMIRQGYQPYGNLLMGEGKNGMLQYVQVMVIYSKEEPANGTPELQQPGTDQYSM
ncbi:MAG: hypothetical protein M3Q97_09300 [Bacteroidota bacterium]|nr:hypothetical protein [Bacteroidota bacterium]